MDTLSNELRELGDVTDHSLCRKVYACGAVASSRSSIRGVSVGTQFRGSLHSLVADLERTQPHYIRCIKPNSAKSAGAFTSGEVLKQLRYSGMMEAIRIRREGYALREEHESFFNRFSVLLNDAEMSGDEAGITQLVEVLSERLHVSDADWQIGHSKIFLRRELAEKLERLAKLRVHVAARTLGRYGRLVAVSRASGLLVPWVRFRIHMAKYHRQERAATILAAAVRGFKMASAHSAAKKAAIKIQSMQRRKMAAQYVRRLRDPYHDLAYRDVKQLLRTKQNLLDEAIAAKDFKRAAELEVRM